jgi:hypothetical protein
VTSSTCAVWFFLNTSKALMDMVLHLPHAEGGFGVSFNCVTKVAAFYTTTSRFVSWMGAFCQERQKLWLPKDDLRDSSSWSSSPLVLLRDIHSKLFTQYDCKEVCVSSQSQGNAGTSARRSSQDGVPQQQEAAPLSLPQLDLLYESSFVRDERSASNAGVTAVPSQFKVTQQVLLKWQPLRDLKLKFIGSRRQEQLSSRYPWVGWGRSGLTVVMSPGLLVSDRRFSPLPWALRSHWLWRNR